MKHKYVGSAIVKKDAKALLSGKPVYTDDLVPENTLVVKLMHSPYAFAKIKSIDVSKAKLIPGIEIIVTYKDVPQKRFTMAGQTYPEPSPHDRLLLDKHVRFNGDAVAIVAGKDEKCVDRTAEMNGIDLKVDFYFPDYKTGYYYDTSLYYKSICRADADSRTTKVNLWAEYLRKFKNDIKLMTFIPFKSLENTYCDLEFAVKSMIDRTISGEYNHWKYVESLQ